MSIPICPTATPSEFAAPMTAFVRRTACISHFVQVPELVGKRIAVQSRVRIATPTAPLRVNARVHKVTGAAAQHAICVGSYPCRACLPGEFAKIDQLATNPAFFLILMLDKFCNRILEPIVVTDFAARSIAPSRACLRFSRRLAKPSPISAAGRPQESCADSLQPSLCDRTAHNLCDEWGRVQEIRWYSKPSSSLSHRCHVPRHVPSFEGLQKTSTLCIDADSAVVTNL